MKLGELYSLCLELKSLKIQEIYAVKQKEDPPLWPFRRSQRTYQRRLKKIRDRIKEIENMELYIESSNNDVR
jgi:hypothetical protein